MDETVAAAAWRRLMLRGDFAAAWRVSDEMMKRRRGTDQWHLPRHEQLVWDGTPVAGRRVLVRCYHGLGDTLHFIRYTAPLRERAKEVSVFAQSELIPLLRTARGIDRLLPLHEGEPEVEREVDVESMELPYLFRTTLDTIPGGVPYLHADATPISRDRHLEVGVAWRAGEWDDRRSVPFPLLAPLARLDGVRLHVLQRGRGADECPAAWGIRSHGDDVLGTAQLMRALDLVITVDSMPAHLAGALAVPTWLLLHADADWRWMRNREDSPWYPTLRLFRQRQPGDWKPVLNAVVDELAALRDRSR